MIVGIDVRDLRLAISGQGTVLNEICRECRLLADDGLVFHFFDSRLPVYGGKNKLLRILDVLYYHYWKQVVLPLKAWRKHCDIVFCTDYFAPYLHLGFQTVQIFHDAFFYEYPAHYNKVWLKLFKHIALPAARRSAYIATVSEYAKKQITHYYKIDPDRLVCIYNGPKSLDTKIASPAIPSLLMNLAGTRYLLHVGMLDKHKNIPALLKALHLLCNNGYPDVQLVLCGKGSGQKLLDDTAAIRETIKTLQLENHVVFAGFVPNEVLPFLYKNATLYVFPSYNEGFGIPLLEAFRFGLPAVVANNTALPEVGGDAVLSFDPFDPADICDKIKQVLDDENLRLTMKEKSLQRMKDFSWAKTTQALITLFKQAMLNQHGK